MGHIRISNNSAFQVLLNCTFKDKNHLLRFEAEGVTPLDGISHQFDIAEDDLLHAITSSDDWKKLSKYFEVLDDRVAVSPDAPKPESWDNPHTGIEFHPMDAILARDAELGKRSVEKIRIQEDKDSESVKQIVETGTETHVAGLAQTISDGQPNSKWDKEKLLEFCKQNNIYADDAMSKNLILRKIRGL